MQGNYSFSINDLKIPLTFLKNPLTTKPAPISRNKLVFKAQNLNTSLNPTRDPPNSKHPKEDLKHKKKPIHNFSIPKIRTLPYIKSLENDLDPKKSENRIEKVVINSSAISLKKKVRISIGNVKFQNFFPNKSPEIEIKVTGCEDLVFPKENIDSSSPKNLCMSNSLNLSSSSKQRSSRRSHGSPSVSPVLSVKRPFENDPFHYLNYLKHTNVTPFYNLLEGITDNNVNSFVYYTRIIKKFSKLQSEEKNYVQRDPKDKFKCVCVDEEKLAKEKAKVFKIRRLKTLVPGLNRFLVAPQPAEFPNNFLIFNFEHVIGSFIKEICIKPGILKIMRKFSEIFRIILITSLDDYKLKAVLNFVERQEILLSGVYRILFPLELHRELGKMLDYSQVFKDFGMESPEKQVLIFTAHRILEPVQNRSEIISMKRGFSKKLNVDRPPVPSEEYENLPITVILPNFQVREHLGIVKMILKQVKSVEKREKIDFYQVLGKGEFEIFRNSDVHEILIRCIRGPESCFKVDCGRKKKIAYCEIHKKFIKTRSEYFCQSNFII